MPRTALQDCPLAEVLARRLREERHALAGRWLERIADRVAIEPNSIFPTEDLLDHVPLLIEGIANYLEDPGSEVGTDTPVVAKAMELGALRHRQGFDVYQILKEYELLGGILFAFLARASDDIPEPCKKSELLYCGQRLFRAVTLIQQATTMHYLRLADQRVAEREERLRAFNRSISHELRNQIGTVLAASDTLLLLPEVPAEQVKQFSGIIAKNARNMKHTLENLVALSRTETDSRQHRHVLLPDAAREGIRQVREAAAEAGVRIETGDLPAVEVNAAAVELCLINYLSNAIKYRDPAQPEHVVRIAASVERRAEGGREIMIRVRDNGLGVPPGKRSGLFHRFFRAHDETVTRAEGTGLGLSIVAETAESLGGRAWAEFPEHGSVFAFSLPFRRAETGDRVDAGASEGAAADRTG